jgi:hypothetical protein
MTDTNTTTTDRRPMTTTEAMEQARECLAAAVAAGRIEPGRARQAADLCEWFQDGTVRLLETYQHVSPIHRGLLLAWAVRDRLEDRTEEIRALAH